MVNNEIASIFRNMAAYLEMQDDQKSFFRARAFEKAADTIESLAIDLSESKYRDIKILKEIDGIGDKIAAHINEYILTGKIPEYDELRQQSPVNLEELNKIQGLGPRKILKLYKKLNITDVNSLKNAAMSDKISELDGFGVKSQASILESINFAIENKNRILISYAESETNSILTYMENDKNIVKIDFAGSLRRRKETIGDIDILVASNDPKFTSEYFCKYYGTEKILAKGDTKSSIWLKAKIQVDLRVVDVSNFGAAMQYFTGSKDHNVSLRNIAIAKGYKLSEYGLFNRLEGTKAVTGKNISRQSKDNNGKPIAGANEQDIYKKLGLQYIEPELRENTIEFDLASSNKLPNLISLDDIKGDLHTHTIYSDGRNTVLEMAKACKELGYKYIGISDHIGKISIANPVGIERFDQYINDIRKAKVDLIKIYAGCEVDIAKDGSLEFDEDKLKELDYVIASVHLNTKMDKESMTKRLIKVLKNPLVKILGHPTGRLINERPGYEFDINEIIKVAFNEGVALEVNAHPLRLDLRDTHIKMAIDAGCKISINTDSHSTQELTNMKYGVYNSRRGFAEAHNLYTLY